MLIALIGLLGAALLITLGICNYRGHRIRTLTRILRSSQADSVRGIDVLTKREQQLDFAIQENIELAHRIERLEQQIISEQRGAPSWLAL